MSEPSSALNIDSVTGIDVSLAVAGPGARSYAFIIDWHIRLILALAWFVVAAVVSNADFSLKPSPGHSQRWFTLVVIPALALYFLYHPAVEVAMRGRTPGKRRVGIRIVTRSGGPPSAGALLVRNVFRLIDSLPVLYGLGLTLVVLTRDSLRCGDMAAGTLLVYERRVADTELLQDASQRIGGRLDPAGAEIAADLLQRWTSLVPEARIRLARALLQRYLGDEADLSEGDEQEWRSRLERLARP